MYYIIFYFNLICGFYEFGEMRRWRKNKKKKGRIIASLIFSWKKNYKIVVKYIYFSFISVFTVGIRVYIIRTLSNNKLSTYKCLNEKTIFKTTILRV